MDISVKLQKYILEQHDEVQLFQELLSRLPTTKFELFLVQAWLIWNQRNVLNFRGKLKDLMWLNRRAADYLDEFWQAQDLLQTPMINTGSQVWQPLPRSMFKLNFDVATFPSLNCLVLGAMIRNEKGKVMTALSARGPSVTNNEEARA